MSAQPNSNEERVVSIPTLLKQALAKWPWLLLLTLLIAALFGAYGLYSGRKIARNTREQTKEEEKYGEYEDQYKEVMNSKDFAYEDLGRALAALEGRQKYVSESLKYNIDPYAEGYAAAEVYVTSADSELPEAQAELEVVRLQQIAQAYAASLEGADYLGDLAKKTGNENDILRELITVTVEDYGYVLVEAIHPESRGAAKVLDAALAQIEQSEDRITRSLGEHNAVIEKQSERVRSDDELALWQSDLRRDMDNLKKNVEAKEEAYEKAEDEIEKEEIPTYTKKNVLRRGVKFGILGLVAGLVLALIALCAWMVLRGIGISPKEFSRQAGSRELGTLRLAGGTVEGDAKSVAAMLTKYLDGKKKIFLTGSVSGDTANKVGDLLSAALKEQGVELAVTAPLSRDPEILKQLEETDAVALIEQAGKTKLSTVSAERELIESWNRPIAGVITLQKGGAKKNG